MIGAIMGDMIGAPYEFDRSPKTKEFPLFSSGSQFTDDSVMTIAVAKALMDTLGKSDDEIKAALVASMQKWGRLYPDAGYGGMFYQWLHAKHPEPYGSFGNGSAMRVSSAGWLFDTLEETRHMARLTAEVTHNHPEGIKGAEAVACAVFMARTGSGKEEIREYIIREFGYDLSRTCDEIRPKYRHVETCQKTVPEAMTAFLEGTDFEDVIRTAVSLGGDCDTLTCIAGGMAEAFYGVPDSLTKECRKRLPDDMLAVLDRFAKMKASEKTEFHDIYVLWLSLILAFEGGFFAHFHSFYYFDVMLHKCYTNVVERQRKFMKRSGPHEEELQDPALGGANLGADHARCFSADDSGCHGVGRRRRKDHASLRMVGQ